MNQRTQEIYGNMSMSEKINFKWHRGMVDFIETIRPKEQSTDKERRDEIKDNPHHRC